MSGGFVQFNCHSDGEIIVVVAEIKSREDFRKLQVVVNGIGEIYFPPTESPPQHGDDREE